MLGRRKHLRFLLSEPVSGNLWLREDVIVEQWGEDEVVVLSPEPITPEERLTLELPGDPHRRTHVRVLESRPAVTGDSAIRHRLRLAIERHGASTARSGAHEP